MEEKKRYCSCETASEEHEHHHEHECEHEHEHHHGHKHHHEHDEDCCHGDGCRCGHDHEHGMDEEELKSEKKKLIIAGSIFIVLLIVDKIFQPAFLQNRIVNTVCYLIPYLIVGWDVIKEAFENLIHGELLGEEFLMTVASLAAFAVGENAEAAAVLVLYSAGELFQGYAVHRSRRSVRELMDLAPEHANLLANDGDAFTQVKPEELNIGDRIAVLPGERIPVDGTVLSGSSMIDTSSMTGEAVPRHAGEGDTIVSGCINGSGKLTVRVDKTYENSTVARVMELTEHASDRKSSTENFITKFARVYTPAVVIGAVILAVIPPLVTRTAFLPWLERACTFLVISCPCALVISIPLSFFGGIGAAGRAGILVKGSNFMEALTHLAVFASDKTGTLTKGEFRVTQILLPDGRTVSFPTEDADALRILRLAAEAEAWSDHPIAVSIREAVSVNRDVPSWTFSANRDTPSANRERPSCAFSVKRERPSCPNSEYVAGRGMRLTADGRVILAGNRLFLEEQGIALPEAKESGTCVYVAEDGNYLGRITISDSVKPEAVRCIKELKELGVRKTVLLTGDSADAARTVRETLGLDDVRHSLLPQDKVTAVEELLSALGKEEKLLYAGDGINDAPVLARADIGVAMGSLGSDAAIEAADVVIMDDHVEKIPKAVRIAKKTVRICRQNIVFALLVKFSFLILGAFGFANMWMAVFADVGVAFLCILNSMRMLAYKEENRL